MRDMLSTKTRNTDNRCRDLNIILQPIQNLGERLHESYTLTIALEMIVLIQFGAIYLLLLSNT